MGNDHLKYSIEELEAMLRKKTESADPSASTASSLPQQKAIEKGITEHFAKLTLSADAVTLLTNYLLAFREERLHLALAQLDVWQATASQNQRLELPSLYTELRTSFIPDVTPMLVETESEKASGRLDDPRLPPSAFTSIHKKAVILGDPGSGKSTFANMLSLCLAGELLRDPKISLSLLPDWSEPLVLDKPWTDAPIPFPLFLTLREFAGSGQTLWAFLSGLLNKKHSSGTATAIESILLEEGGLLILDGLDEVPKAKSAREGIVTAVHEFTQQFPQAQVLVTSRPYAYKNDGWALEGFTPTQLAPFDEKQRRLFLERWFSHAAPKKGLSSVECERRRNTLSTQIEAQKHLRDLAENPLLLTLISLLDLQTSGAVPQNREELYSKSVELLLEIWQKPVFELEAPTLQEYLGVTRGDLQKCIEEIAFDFHEEQGHQPGLADIPDGKVLSALRNLAKSHGGNTDDLADYLENRAGLLTHHGSIYRFPHRSFQEYLAARWLSDLDDDAIVRHLHDDPQVKWREPFLLAGAKIKKSRVPAAWHLICQVLDSLPDNSTKFSDTDWRIAALLGRLIYEIRFNENEEALSSSDLRSLKSIRNHLVTLVENPNQPLPVPERFEAGQFLGHIGDPRPGVGCDENGIPNIEWVDISAGDFLFGDEKETATIAGTYSIARYLVTEAQFATFEKDGGYEDDSWWHGDDWDGRQGSSRRPDQSDNQGANFPQVNVSWFEAKAFCAWLSEKLNHHVDLPTDIQWERAARGTEGRIYPWGNSKENIEGRCNMSETGLNQASPVGLFPSGKADMIDDLSGNVWEWSSDWFDSDKDSKVLRGGSFLNYTTYVRSAIRDWDLRDRGGGFRVVSPPFQSPKT